MGDKNSILDTIGEWAEKFTGSESQGEGQGQAQGQGDTPENGGEPKTPENGGEPKTPENGGEPQTPENGCNPPNGGKDGEPANGGQPKKTGDSGKKGKTGDTGKTDKDGKDENENKKEDTIDKVNNTVHEVSETINAFSNLIDAVKKQDATLTLKEVCAPTKLGEEAFHQLESLDMSKLIGAPINAAIDAHYNAAKKALECINEMGVKDGTLAVVTFNFFRNGKMAKMSIPLLTLVPIATMRIKEMTYDFKVKINTDSSINLVTGNENVFSYGVGLNNGKSEQAPAAKSEAAKKEGEAKAETPKAGEGENKGKETEAKGKEGEAKKEGAAAEGAAGKGGQTADAAATAVKNAARVEPTFGVSFSSKKDSTATQNSKYSVETSMDIKLTVVSDENIPAGVSRMLEILNNAVEVYNPNGELSVSSNMVKIANDYAVVSVVYMDGDGCLALDKITCKCITNGDVKPSLLNGGDKVQILFDTPGTYIISAGALQSPVIVEGESK